MVFLGIGFSVAGGLKLMGFGWFWAWFLVLCGGSQWVSGWVLGHFRWGFGSRWVAGWLTVVVSIFGRFRWFWVWVFFFVFCFMLLQTHNVKYLLDYFPRMKTNTGKTIIFPEIIYIYKHFTVKNNLHRNKQSLKEKYLLKAKVWTCLSSLQHKTQLKLKRNKQQTQ